MENRITVFVPTYNRAKLLPKLLSSLNEQDYKQFELLVVDDGSTDNTKELIEQWILKNAFKINYVYQENSGKHVAYNKAISRVCTELFLELDSDDYLTDDALSTIIYTWDTKCNKDRIANIQYLCKYKDDRIIGTKFPKTISNNYEIRQVDKVKGDKGIVYVSARLKEFTLPYFKNESVVYSILHNRVSRKYEVYCLNKALKVVEYLDSGISITNRTKKRPRYLTMMLRYNEFNYFDITLGKYIHYNSKYVKNALMANKTIKEIFNNAINRKGIFVLSFVHGYLAYLAKRIKK
ncbi:glycosyltransferase family A protein [Wenyingzhuangia sp. 2_MG-2023]|uniref:glycosyltransferase family A protein n=1 Tax=Wenyingzhuangia sp. 2_MG-2023 TaxID=3062639 RepID=UPI0026E222E1|nr:glycosyltransferase family 2 protein [Wenyingzhuangia sp. 2_MG-2023]MDO6737540.1 glycosyltransferase family 2 protein [Wenyingzhuangia sp. 2_MG-2023]